MKTEVPHWVKIGEGARCRSYPYLLIIGICNSGLQELLLDIGEAYQIRDLEMPCFLTFQAVDWTDVFSRKVSRDFILENLTYCRKEKGLYLFGYVIMANRIHLVVQQKDGKL